MFEIIKVEVQSVLRNFSAHCNIPSCAHKIGMLIELYMHSMKTTWTTKARALPAMLILAK